MMLDFTEEHVKRLKDAKREMKFITTFDKVIINEKGEISGSYGIVAHSGESITVGRDSFSVSLPTPSGRNGSTSGGSTFHCLDSNRPINIYKSDIKYGRGSEKKYDLKIETFAQFLRK